MDTQSPESVETAPTSRRALIASLIGAGAAVVAAGRASAADSPTDTTAPSTMDSAAPQLMSAAPTTTIAPPSHSESDVAPLNALLALEADVVATYRAAAAKTSGDDLAALTLIQENHLSYVQAIEGYLGRKAVQSAGTARAVAGTGYAEIATALAKVEGDAVRAHLDALAGLQGLDAATLVASIITVEARHRAALLVSATGTVDAVTGN